MTVKHIAGFEIDEVLKDVHTQKDFIGKFKEKELADDALLIVFESGQAAIKFQGYESIELMYNDEVSRMFEQLDKYTAAEFVTILSRNSGVYKSL